MRDLLSEEKKKGERKNSTEEKRIIHLDVSRNNLAEKKSQEESNVILTIRRVLLTLSKDATYKQGLDAVALTVLSVMRDDDDPEDYIVSLIEYFEISAYFSDKENVSSSFLTERLSFLNALLFFHAPQLCLKLREQGLAPELYAVSWIVTIYADVFKKCQDLLKFWDVLILAASSDTKVQNSLLIGVSLLLDVQHVLRSSSFETNLLLFSEMKRGLKMAHVERTLSLFCELLKRTPKRIAYFSKDSEDSSSSYPYILKEDFMDDDITTCTGDLIVTSQNISKIVLRVKRDSVSEKMVTRLSGTFTPREAQENNLMLLVVKFNKETEVLMECLVLAGYSNLMFLLLRDDLGALREDGCFGAEEGDEEEEEEAVETPETVEL